MNIPECKARLPLPDLLVKLGFDRADSKGFLPSPFREGESGDSFHIWLKDGQWFFKDHAGGLGGDEVSFLEQIDGITRKAAMLRYHELAGVEVAQAQSSDAKRSTGPKEEIDWGHPAATYSYVAEDGLELFQVLKFLGKDGKKTFRQRRKKRLGEDSKNGWVWRVEEAERVLYRLPEVLACPASQPIFLVEGEKCVEALRGLGLCATTMACGAKEKGPVNWNARYTTSLAGKWVVLMGDNDAPGRRHVEAVAELLRPVVAKLGVVDIAREWAACPPKGDVADWIEWAAENGGMLLAEAERN